MGRDGVNYNPLYLQVKDVLLKRIASGIYSPGDCIPSEFKLADDFGTSISTIRQAVSILVSEGYLRKKQGKGTFVSDRKVELSFLSWVGETKKGLKILEDLIGLFEKKHPSLLVKLIPATYMDTRRVLLNLISNGNAPDVAQIVSHWTSYFASMGAFEPLDELLAEDNMKTRSYDKDLFGGMYQKRLYSVSWGLCPVSLIANRNVLEEANIDAVHIPMTLEEFFNTCKKIDSCFRKTQRYAYGLCFSRDEIDFLRIYTFLQAFNGGCINEKGELVFDSKENVAGFRWLRRFASSVNVYIDDIYTIREKFARDEIAFISDGPWIKYVLEELTGEEFHKRFRVVLNPVHFHSCSYSWNYNHALAVCSQSKHKMHAARFIDSITNDHEISNFYYSRVGHLPVNQKYLNDPMYDTDYFTAFKKQLANMYVINAQNSMFEKAMVLCKDAVDKILFEGAEIEKELHEKQYYLKMLYYE